MSSLRSCGLFLLLAVLLSGCASDRGGLSDKDVLGLELYARLATVATLAQRPRAHDAAVVADMKEEVVGMRAVVSALGDDPHAGTLGQVVDQVDKHVGELEALRPRLESVYGAIDSARLMLPKVAANQELATQAMQEAGVTPDQLRRAHRQSVLLERIAHRLTDLRRGDETAASAADMARRDFAAFAEVAEGFVRTNSTVEALTDPRARLAQGRVIQALAQVQPALQTVLVDPAPLMRAHAATEDLVRMHASMRNATSVTLAKLRR